MKKKLKVNFKSEQDLNFKNGEIFHRMGYLMKLGASVYKDNPQLAKVYSYMVKDMGKRNAMRVDSKIKKLICANCNNLLFLDKNSHLEIDNTSGKSVLQVKCNDCNNLCKVILF